MWVDIGALSNEVKYFFKISRKNMHLQGVEIQSPNNSVGSAFFF